MEDVIAEYHLKVVTRRLTFSHQSTTIRQIAHLRKISTVLNMDNMELPTIIMAPVDLLDDAA